jgi:hypothetical protein
MCEIADQDGPVRPVSKGLPRPLADRQGTAYCAYSLDALDCVELDRILGASNACRGNDGRPAY